MSFRLQEQNVVNSNKSNFNFEHYVHLFQRNLWFIIPVTLLAITLWFLAITVMGLIKPKLEATAILQFDDPKNLSAIESQVGIQPNAKEVLLKSRSFLEIVARKLSLQLQIDKFSRNQIFDSSSVGFDAPIGFYQFSVHNNTYELNYYPSKNKKSKTTIQTGTIGTLGSINKQGLYLRFVQNFKNAPFNFDFSVTRLRDAVDFIGKNLITKTTGKDESIMSVTIAGRDYELITDIVNAVVDNFVDENSSLNLYRQSGVLKVIEKQLETAKAEMIDAESTLRKFRNANPTVGLKDAFSPPIKIMDLKESEADLRAAKIEGNSLLSRYATVNDSERIELLNEMISFLNKFQAATASGLQTELNNLAENERLLKDNYSPYHPLVQEQKKNTRAYGVKVITTLHDLLNQLDRRIAENNTRIDQIQSEVAKLPSKEIELANLQRKYDVNSQIYSSVLTKYNEAKIAKAVAIGDVYIVDHAVVPENGFNPKSFVVVIGIGLFLGIFFGFGPIVTIDFFDRTAKTEKDLVQMTDFSLLESIPVKDSWNSWKHSDDKTVCPKLITSDYSQDFADESYRSLRAKILLSLHSIKSKRILITSLNMAEGKSFTSANVAITMAQQRIPTLLIDGDLRRGVLHKYFALNKNPGLSDLLCDTQKNDFKSALQQTHIPDLWILSSGKTVPESAALLNSDHFRQLLCDLSRSFEVIIFDTPPIAVVSDAIGIQDSFEKLILVVRASQTNISELNRKLKEYPKLQSKVLGIVFNGAPYKRNEYYQYKNYKY